MKIFIFDQFEKISEEDYAFLYSLLPFSRKKKADERSGIDKKICILEYFLVRRLLALENFEDFSYNKFGKPYILGKHFSIAHTEDVLCIAVSSREVGVDIEREKECSLLLAKYILNEQEQKVLENSQNKNLDFTRFFVKKEAYIKCKGQSLATPLKEIDTSAFDGLFYYKDFVIACIEA